MPVIECSCGMVMSVSAAAPRKSCIRCGGAEFRELVWRGPVVSALECSSLLSATTYGNWFSMALLPMAGSAAESVIAGCFR
jgi:hypothetical protein